MTLWLLEGLLARADFMHIYAIPALFGFADAS
jgi:hypothetical protein